MTALPDLNLLHFAILFIATFALLIGGAMLAFFLIGKIIGAS